MTKDEAQYILLSLWARLTDAGLLNRGALSRCFATRSEWDWSCLSAEAWRPRLAACLTTGKNWAELQLLWSDWLSSDAYVQTLEKSWLRGTRALYRGGQGYPEVFMKMDDPPPILFVRGALTLLERATWTDHCVTLVGTRRPSSYGQRCAEQLGALLAEAGLTLVSGLAYGIDAIAQNGAQRRGGRCVAVLASSLENIYPPAHRPLSVELERNGLLMSERALGSELKRYHFPMRNRLMSALGRCCVVLEAGQLSGSLITAHISLNQGKDVWALPGRIDCPQSKGSNYLIENGAFPLTDFAVFMDWLRGQEIVGPPESCDLESGEAHHAGALEGGGSWQNSQAWQDLCRRFKRGQPRVLLDYLAEGDQSAESLALNLKMEASELFELLAELEQLGLLSFAGGVYRRLI